MKDTLFAVIPCYKEEEVLPQTAETLKTVFDRMIASGKISKESRIVFVNDGSTDRTWEIICSLHGKDTLFRGLNLSRNRGHQNALLAGLMTVREEADMVVSLDADLQDDPAAIEEMVDRYHQGADIVYGIRKDRARDTFFKRFTAEAFYRTMNMLGAQIVFNHADFRLMSRRALEGLASFREVNLFLRGIVPMIGFRTDTVYYERAERRAGQSKYPLRKMLALAWEGLTSLSIRPIRIITVLGLIVFVASLILLIYFLVIFFLGRTVQGWATIVISVWGIGGLQLLAIGILGEYVGKVYLETKHRPRYLIEQYLKEEPGGARQETGGTGDDSGKTDVGMESKEISYPDKGGNEDV